MEVKKNPKIDLENKKGLFFQVGLIISLALVLAGFEYKRYDKANNENLNQMVVNYTEESVEITRQEKQEPPKPQPVTKIEVVEDDVDTQDDIDINIEDNQNQEVQAFVPPTQDEEEPQVQEQEIFVFVEEQPEFPGGEEALMAYLQSNIRYPQMAKELEIQGKVIIEFVVETDGSVTNVVVKRGIGGGCDEEAVRVVKAMPKWKPGKQRGKPVRVRYTLPVTFQLR
ncbi:MAG: TonB family protein [Bacteroidales bacterium]|nr:TonB family protein [Bacteroidales bacterium]